MREPSKKRKKAAVAAIIVFALLIALAVLLVTELNRYTDTHTWATVSVSGEIHADTDEAFSEAHEYLKGDTVTFGGVTLKITDITHDGTVTFSVQQGELFTQSGEAVSGGSIVRDEKTYYTIQNGTVVLTVTDNRYQ